ncbi:hypothetical protein HHK36_015314 [Tetracentron sinense]|uniref:Uncharacterized protein n=1 Tax=Tetracentron sinense TaxID=13715 RepID=A0A834Z1S4_TETSI|nr:hypothetical protein HHK36_015314 [Tetracentron sinense]
MELVANLPQSSELSSSLISFLGKKLHREEDLLTATDLVSELQKRCSDLDHNLIDLNQRLGTSIVAHASHSDRIGGIFGENKIKLSDLQSSTCVSGPFLGLNFERFSFPPLAKLKTALKLDNLVGEIEDAEIRLLAIKSLKLAKDVLTLVTKTRPQQKHLVSAVDRRVGRALTILRPQAIADHRALVVASLGWPPPLSTLNSTNANIGRLSYRDGGNLGNSRGITGKFLCTNQFGQLRSLRISLAYQCHFSKWVEKPEFIFALMYKITRYFVEPMDELLQPLVDKARLAGYSCREEEWIAAMVTLLSMFLAKEILPIYVGQLEEESVTVLPSQARISWLHLVDLMIAFDKRVQSLAAQSGVLLSVEEDETLQRISSMYVFCDHPDWLDLSAEMELRDILDKLKPEMEDKRSWTIKVQGTVIMSGSEDYKSLKVINAFLRHFSTVVECCWPLPSILLRARFARLAVTPIIQEFLDCLLRKCQEAEILTALADVDALIQVANSISAARYFESVLKEWCEDVFILVMVFDQEDQLEVKASENSSDRGRIERPIIDYLQGIISILERNLNGMGFVGVWRSLVAGVDRLLFNGIVMSNVKFYDGGVERFGGDLELKEGLAGGREGEMVEGEWDTAFELNSCRKDCEE